MRLNPDDLRLQAVRPVAFQSFWPSEDALLDPKMQALLDRGVGAAGVLQSIMKSNWDAYRISMRNKATIVGDFLTKQLNIAAKMENTPLGKVPWGIFATVEWGLVLDDPAQAMAAMARVGVPAALTALTAVPLAGQLAMAYFAAGEKLLQMYTARINNRMVQMPLAQYSKSTDEALTRDVILAGYSQRVDRTGLFMPPWNVDASWRLGVYGEYKGPAHAPRLEGGYVWAPWKNKEIPWGTGVGAIPGTIRVFGQIQVSGPGTHAAVLRRNARAPAGVTPKDVPLLWPPTVTNTGDFFPSTASTAAMLWSQAGDNGSPDMYTIHVDALLDAWKRAFESMEESFDELWKNPGALKQDIGVLTNAEARRTLGAAMAPWTAMRLGPKLPWQLGLPWQVPSNWALVTPELRKGGKPGDPAGRTPSLWIEEALAHDLTLMRDAEGKPIPGMLQYPGWPYRDASERENGTYGSLPRQHHCAKWKACTADLAATINLEHVIHPASYLKADGPAPPGYRKVPWPPPEVDAALYASPWTAIIRPALQRLRAQQVACLKRTLVCAYVRPVKNSSGEMYGAFRDTALQKLCLDLRQALLNSPARFAVNLRDAQDIDADFAQQLRDRGVTGTPSDFAKSLGRTAVVPEAPTPPPNEPPQGGIPFGGLRGRRVGRQPKKNTSGGGGWLALLAFGGAAAGGAWALTRRKGRR